MIIKYTESLYKRDSIKPTCPGTEEVPTYALAYKKDGGVYLKEKGIKPIYQIIQANKVNCDLSTVLEQCIHENQLAVTSLNDVESAIADFTAFTDFADIFTGVKELGQMWTEMPIEVREQFNSSKSSFVSSIASPDFNDKLKKGYDAYYGAIHKRLDVAGSVPKPAPLPNIDEQLSTPDEFDPTE